MFYKTLVIIAGLLSSVVLGDIVTRNLVLCLRNKHNFPKDYDRETKLLGYLERFVYTCAILLNFPAFIGIWLGVKLVGRWNPNVGVLEQTETGEKLRGTVAINIFLIGNLMSLIFAALGAYIIIKFLR